MNDKYKGFSDPELQVLIEGLLDFAGDTGADIATRLADEISDERQARHDIRSFTTTSDERRQTGPTLNFRNLP